MNEKMIDTALRAVRVYKRVMDTAISKIEADVSYRETLRNVRSQHYPTVKAFKEGFVRPLRNAFRQSSPRPVYKDGEDKGEYAVALTQWNRADSAFRQFVHRIKVSAEIADTAPVPADTGTGTGTGTGEVADTGTGEVAEHAAGKDDLVIPEVSKSPRERRALIKRVILALSCSLDISIAEVVGMIVVAFPPDTK